MGLIKLFQKSINPASNGKQLFVSYVTDPGKIRDNNEDNFCLDLSCIKTEDTTSGTITLSAENTRVFAVFDGMGGEAFGEEASHIAAKTLQKHIPRFNETNTIRTAVNEFVKQANLQICDMIRQKCCHRSGCTMALVCIRDNKVYAFTIGDSRIYYYNGVLHQISEDQTLAVQKLQANIYTEEEARNSNDAHKITSYLGIDQRNTGVSMHSYKPFSLGKGTILLCSDGLTDMCRNAFIADILCNSKGDKAQNLLNAALANGGEDNITCVLISNQI